MRRRWTGGAWRAAVLVVAILAPLIVGFVWFADNLPEPTSDGAQTDAIVVLTGGSDRISTGISLAVQSARVFPTASDRLTVRLLPR